MSSTPDNEIVSNRGRGIALRERLILTIVVVSALMTVPTLYALSRLRSLRSIANTAVKVHGRAYASLGRFGARLGDVNRFEGSYVVTADPNTRLARDSALADAHKYLDSLESANYVAEAKPARAHL